MREKSWRDDDAQFLRDADAVNISSSGAMFLISADGRHLGRVNFRMKGLEKCLRSWNALPESARVPGAVEIPPRGEPDPERAALQPPEGCLVLRVFNRELRRADGGFRHVGPEDYPATARRETVERLAESRQDFMWILREEWQALAPAEAQVGDEIAVPRTLLMRLLRYHMNPLLGLRGAICFTDVGADSGRLTARVVEVAGDRVRLRLEGSACLRQVHHEDGPLKYSPALRGELTYDRATRKVTALSLVALGDLRGSLSGFNGPEPGKMARPLGIAFELVRNPTPAELLRPHGAVKNRQGYLHPKP